MQEALPYWMALAHLPDWTIQQKNELIVHCFEEKKSILDLFQADREELISHFRVEEQAACTLQEAQKEVANYAFMAEDLLNQGFDLLPLLDKGYPELLKRHLKKPASPPCSIPKAILNCSTWPAFPWWRLLNPILPLSLLPKT